MWASQLMLGVQMAQFLAQHGPVRSNLLGGNSFALTGVCFFSATLKASSKKIYVTKTWNLSSLLPNVMFSPSFCRSYFQQHYLVSHWKVELKKRCRYALNLAKINKEHNAWEGSSPSGTAERQFFIFQTKFFCQQVCLHSFASFH